MNTLERTTGNAFTRDVDYNKFLGRQYKGVMYDWSRRCYVECIMQAPKTPRDHVSIIDPNTTIADEGTDPDGNPRKTYEVFSRTQAIVAQIHEVLQDRPLSTVEIASALGLETKQLKFILMRHSEGLEVVARSRGGFVYGIKGRVYPEPYLSKSMPRIYAYLKEHGPNTFNQIYLATGIPAIQIRASIDDNPGIMVIVGRKHGKGQSTDIWGLAGIHDKAVGHD